MKGSGARNSGLGGRGSGAGSRKPEARSPKPEAGSPKPAVGLIACGTGNLASVQKGLRTAGADVTVITTPAEVERCDGIVVPGVGNFQSAASLDATWRAAILSRVEAGVPLLGICLGMQLLFDGSDEARDVPGLGLFEGRCRRIAAQRPVKVPHVGWNSLAVVRSSEILRGIEHGAYVYFTHSFAAPLTAGCVASAVHGVPFAAVIEKGRVAGVQFHPEKSGDTGLQILRNFVRTTRM